MFSNNWKPSQDLLDAITKVAQQSREVPAANTESKPVIAEEAEQLDELSDKTVHSYADKAHAEIKQSRKFMAKRDPEYKDPKTEGIRHRQFKRYRGLDSEHVAKLKRGYMGEGAEVIAELSKKVLGNYIKKASNNIGHQARSADAHAEISQTKARHGKEEDAFHHAKQYVKHTTKAQNRRDGIGKAVARLTAEDYSVDAATWHDDSATDPKEGGTPVQKMLKKVEELMKGGMPYWKAVEKVIKPKPDRDYE